MDDKKIEEIAKMVANESYARSIPIDIDGLISKGIVKQVGKSYYVENLKLLPEDVRKRIKNVSKGRHGLRIEFYKETKSMAKLANKFRHLRD